MSATEEREIIRLNHELDYLRAEHDLQSKRMDAMWQAALDAEEAIDAIACERGGQRMDRAQDRIRDVIAAYSQTDFTPPPKKRGK